ncbi:T9SS type A sorting domain-containing protein [candidate division WOR-3 bacterium]|uniref:T9SS type A sorting domain-containing protein n=1 Tax=candidate division WOR-3 bacterium TaxID=2052148 RepID=A0A937XDF7_UNCW3|nr:T9SS type A sorting domain-containing protein [candidate division WOR-3 bacterium]
MSRMLGVLFCTAGLAVGQVGRIDTVGTTTYDWQTGGPAYRMLVNAAVSGLHAGWIYSIDSIPFPDRNMRYNFYDYQSGSWRWSLDGISVFAERSGFGNLDCDPTTGAALVSAHAGRPIVVARDTAPGAGVFEYCTGPSESPERAALAVGANRRLHAAAIDDYGQLWYSRCTTWGTWSVPMHVPPPEPDPGFPSHSITASKVSPKLTLTWVKYWVDSPQEGFYRTSSDGGTSWDSSAQLPAPPAFGGDTAPSFYLGVFPYYDRHDRLHVVAEVVPLRGGQQYVMPAEIWHWCEENNPQWSRVHRAGTALSTTSRLGYNAVLAGRPSIGEDRNGGLYVAWEQFDTANIEPSTDRARADVWYASDNYDNGASWVSAVRTTVPDLSSKRFPSVVDLLARDTLCVLYTVDSVAGFFVHGEGPATQNPVVVQFVPVEVGGLETRQDQSGDCGLEVWPNPSLGHVRLRFSLIAPSQARLEVFDFAGRLVKTAVQARLHSGSHVVDWDGTDSRGHYVPAGVYFCNLVAEDRRFSRKVVLTD